MAPKGTSKPMFRRYAFLLLVILTINFILPRAMRSDPFLYLSSDADETSAYSKEQIVQYRAYYGLDRPLWRQYLSYLQGFARGDLGQSIYYRKPVSELILGRLPWTVGIVLSGLLLGISGGVLLGSLSAWNAGGRFDRALYRFMVAGSQVPAFVTGIVVLLFFAVAIPGLPLSGGRSPFASLEFDLHSLADVARHAVLPVMTLTLVRLPDFFLTSRSAMLHEIRAAYVLTARAKGLGTPTILFGHCLRNAANPIMTRALLSLANTFGGALVVENVFKYPGVGTLIREAVFQRDYILMQGAFMAITILTLSVNGFAELFYSRRSGRFRNPKGRSVP